MQRRVIKVPGKFMIVEFTDSVPPEISSTLVNLRTGQSIDCEIFAITEKSEQGDKREWVKAKIALTETGPVVSIPWQGQYITTEPEDEDLCDPDFFRFAKLEKPVLKVISRSDNIMADLKPGCLFRFSEEDNTVVRKVKEIVDNNLYAVMVSPEESGETDIYELSDRKVVLIEEEKIESNEEK